MSSHCYSYIDLEARYFPYFPCGPVNNTNPAVPCCGGNDSCLSGGICSYDHSQVGGSGYYSAACTDEAFQDDSCKLRCTDQLRSDVQYLADRGLWACCGTDENTGSVDCANPTNETFKLDAPEDLLIVFKVPATGFNYTSESIPSSTSTSAPATSSITSPTSTSTTTTTSPPPQPTISAGLSSSAAAGIGVGVAAAVIITAVLAWLAFRQRGRRRAATSQGENQPLDELASHDGKKLITETLPQSNSPNRQSQVAELTGHQSPRELYG
ncbi:hypothetical protein F4678DRAFT_441373 [Xylaria arbuscula]|nr:hypothetical protein F4678DRAFT_441373 [Xylaria arbuscula]